MKDEIKEILDNPKILMLSYGNYISLNDYVKLKDYITNLQEENESLKGIAELRKDTLIMNQNKVDKAIEYIKSYNLPKDLGSLSECPISVGELKQLLSILQGEDK